MRRFSNHPQAGFFTMQTDRLKSTGLRLAMCRLMGVNSAPGFQVHTGL
jgi:hypothetical protein